MTKSLLVLNVGNVLISDQRIFESHMKVHTREQAFACLQYNTGSIHLVQRLTPKKFARLEHKVKYATAS